LAFLGELTPEQGFLHHRENLLAIYRTGLYSLQENHGLSVDSAIDRFSFHYYSVLLLNIPTLFRMQAGKLNHEVIDYTIKHSLRCALAIPTNNKLRNLLLIKLYLMEVGITRVTGSKENLEQAINTY